MKPMNKVGSSFIMIVVQGPILTQLSRKFSPEQLIGTGAFVLGLSFYLLNGQNITQLYLAITLLSIGNGIMWPSFLSQLSAIGNSQNQGSIQGYGSSTGSFASVLGLVLGGLLFEKIAENIFFIGTVVFFIVFVLSLKNTSTKSISTPSI